MSDNSLEARTMPSDSKPQFMPMSDILSLQSLDAEAENDYRERHGLPAIGTTVADVVPATEHEVDTDRARYEPVEQSMATGQSVPIGVCNGYLINGLHRVVIALRAGWVGMHVTCDFAGTIDYAWNEAHPDSSWT